MTDQNDKSARDKVKKARVALHGIQRHLDRHPFEVREAYLTGCIHGLLLGALVSIVIVLVSS